jgi:hypothetical protein
MNTEALILFLIILLGLVLCSFLGGKCYTEGFEDKKYTNTQTTGMNYAPTETVSEIKPTSRQGKNYDNYNHFNKSFTNLVEGTMFYGPNGGTVVVKTNSDGTQSLEITSASGDKADIFTMDQTTTIESMTTSFNGVYGDTITFRGPNNATATVIYTNDGQQAIRVRTNNGTVTYTLSGTTIYNPDINNTPGYNPPGSVGPYNPPGYNNPPGSIGPYNPPGVDKTYFDSLPPGVPRSQIPPGDEDLYILKSQVVPPVCPACPANPNSITNVGGGAVNNSVGGGSVYNAAGGSVYNAVEQSKCPPCPACERCPEPAFECKKVPSYSGLNSYLPVPVLSDFSTFGM